MELRKKTVILGQIPLFAPLPANGIKYLATSLREQSLPPDTLLLREGDQGDRFFIVLEGRLEIIKGLGSQEEKLLDVRGPGDFIGEMSFFLSSGLRTASVRTRTHVQVLEVNGEVFDKILQRWPEIAVEMARTLSRRLRDSDNARIQEMRKRQRQVSKVFSELQSSLIHASKDAVERDLQRDESSRLLSEFARFQAELLNEGIVPDVQRKALEINRAIRRSGVPRLMIKTFGGFALFRDETLVEESAWEGIQPKLLLKAIIAHRSQGVPKDVLIEALWPEVSPVSGERNFKVILHRLRKTLEPDMNKDFGSSYIHLKANLVSLDEELCHVDIDDFNSLCRRGEQKHEEGDIKSAIELFKQALELYAGDFLSEDLYASWADPKRNELRERYICLLFRVGELLEKQGNLKTANDYYRKVVQIDPTLEPAYQRLILNYCNRGMKNAALKTYEDCARVLRKELDTEPDPLTTSLYKKVLETT